MKDKLLEQRRQTANLNIINALTHIVNEHPELRFTQILTILKLDTDRFFEEPWVTLEKVYETISQMKWKN